MQAVVTLLQIIRASVASTFHHLLMFHPCMCWVKTVTSESIVRLSLSPSFQTMELFWSILSKTVASSSYSECSHPGFVFPHNLFPSEPWQPVHMIWQKIVFHWFLTWYPRFSLIILFLSWLRGVVAPTDSRRQLRLVLLLHKVTVSMATGPWLVFPLFSLFLIYFSPLSFHICDRCVWRALWATPPTLTHVPPDRKLLSLKH